MTRALADTRMCKSANDMQSCSSVFVRHTALADDPRLCIFVPFHVDTKSCLMQQCAAAYRWRAASKLANRLGLLSRNSGKHKSQKQRKRAEVGISHSIHKVSSCLHRHRHSESLMTSYLRMQAATAEAEVATGRHTDRQRSRESFGKQATAVTEVAMGRQTDRQPDGHVQEERCDDGHSVQVSGYSPASQLAGQPDPALRLGTLRGAAGEVLCQQESVSAS